MGKIKIITSKDRDKVLNIQEIQELNVIDLRLSYDLIEVTDDDLVAWLHHLLVMVLESIQVQLQNRLFIQKFADYEFTKILKKFLTVESISLRIQGIEIGLWNLIFNRSDILKMFKARSLLCKVNVKDGWHTWLL